MDDIKDSVRHFYSSAAQTPLKELCCPVDYPKELTSHIPDDAFEVSYGCGSPVARADIKSGETIVDLGSGAGIDCFIAARLVGRHGRVIGIDMTDEMLGRAEDMSRKVARNLGYNVVEFRKGFLEAIPLESESADVVVSNCVINLSADKTAVAREILRILKPEARLCVSDIVSDKYLPEDMQRDRKLWGECISGALREDEFFRIFKESGLYGLHIISRYLYRKERDIRFYSVTFKGYKLAKSPTCVYMGHYAIYNGPFKGVEDDDKHFFPAGQAVEICTDTAAKLKRPPYEGHFIVIEPDENKRDTCRPDKNTKCC
ncbi:MAG: methyltransferase domain-containing protein [Deltaproteobacteria bacterium]|nr:methyltransferase domain-containing protein [Deltaproteobacteria bacterium]